MIADVLLENWKLFFIQFTKGNFTTVIKHNAFKNSYLQSFKFTHVSSI